VLLDNRLFFTPTFVFWLFLFDLEVNSDYCLNLCGLYRRAVEVLQIIDCSVQKATGYAST